MPTKLPKSPVGRVSFPSVWKATAMDDDPKSRKTFSVTLLFSPEAQKTPEFLAMKKAAEAAAREKWGEGVRKIKLRSPFRKCEEKDHLSGYQEGWIFVRFSGERRPKVVDRGKNLIDEESGDFYAGCHAHVSYTAPYAYDKGGNRGVAFGLSNVQKVKDDEPFGGVSSDPDEDFDEVDYSDEDNDSLSGDDYDEDDVLG